MALGDDRLDLLNFFGRGKVARAVGYVILETIGLLVRLVAVWFRTPEGLGEEHGCCRP